MLHNDRWTNGLYSTVTRTKLSAMGSKIHSQFIPGEAIPGVILNRNGVSLVNLGEREAAVIFLQFWKKKKIQY